MVFTIYKYSICTNTCGLEVCMDCGYYMYFGSLSARAPYCMYYNDAKVPGFISGPDTNYPVFSLNHVHVFTKCYYFLCVIMCMLLVALCMFDCGSFLTFSLEKKPIDTLYPTL